MQKKQAGIAVGAVVVAAGAFGAGLAMRGGGTTHTRTIHGRAAGVTGTPGGISGTETAAGGGAGSAGSGNASAGGPGSTVGTVKTLPNQKAVVSTTTTTPAERNLAADAPPRHAADGLFVAWQHDDRSAAAHYATTDAINQLWTRSWSASDRFAGCEQNQLGEVVCSYSYEQGYLRFYVASRSDQTWQVAAVQTVIE